MVVVEQPKVSLKFISIAEPENVSELDFVADKDGDDAEESQEQEEPSNVFDNGNDEDEATEVTESKEEIPADTSGCSLVCLDNSTDFVEGLSSQSASDEGAVKLKFLTHQYGWWTLPIAEAYNELHRGQVEVEVVQVPVAELFPNIINEAESEIGLYDGFFTGPGVLGSIVDHNGFADLTDYINESAERSKDWLDVLLGYRQEIAQYEDKILMYPLDGDTLSLFYRRDILDHFGLRVPRTWDEYNQVARATHGKEYGNQTLVGSCVARKTSCSNAYWANLVLSTMTQTKGPSQGHLFDTQDLTPLTGEAMEETLALLEKQAMYGADEEFGDGCIGPVNFNLMFEGKCVLTYNWGNNFKRYLEQGTALAGNYGVAPTPGSQKVLDRETMKLVDCTAERCQHAEYFDDLGYVNRAPYLAFGGWACAVNNYTDDRKKRLAMDFCAFAASQEESIKAVIPEATGNTTVAGRPTTQNGQDPFRSSHLDEDRYVAMGYERETTAGFINAIRSSLESPNLVKDIRFPTSSDIYGVLDVETHAYLNDVRWRLISEEERAERRRVVSENITNQMTHLIAVHNSKSSTKTPVLESYQRLRNVYSPEVDENHLDGIRGYGIALACLIMFLSIVFGIWTLRYKATKVVRASQPFFLLMLLSGCIVFGSAIIPLGIDDGSHSAEAASKACMSVPWLIAIGWSIIFSALFSKLWRVNIVYKSAMKFRRLKVSEKDVLLPFAVLFTSNLIVLVVWTVMDPLVWRRFQVSETESYGTCATEPGSNVWRICLSILAVMNSLALILANVEAFKSRHVATEYGESKHIGMIMGSILQVVLVGLPLLFLVNDNPTASYFIRSSIVFVISMSVLLLIFVPKIHIWYTSLNNKSADRKDSSSRRGSGLRFTIRQDPSVMAQKAGKLNEYKDKLKHLEQILVERGVDVQPLFQEAGINMDSLADNSDMAANAQRTAGTFTTNSQDSSNPYASSADSDDGVRLASVQESVEEGEDSSPPEQRPLN